MKYGRVDVNEYLYNYIIFYMTTYGFRLLPSVSSHFYTKVKVFVFAVNWRFLPFCVELIYKDRAIPQNNTWLFYLI